MSAALDAWFTHEILVHEAALLHYLARHWPHRDELHDLRQEVYARVYRAAGQALPQQPRAFLFTTARHLLADRARRLRVVSIEPMGDFEHSHVLIDDVSPERWCGGRQALMRLAEALDRLPDRCREVVWLRRVEELSQKEVAMRLGISEKTVEKQIAKGMRLMAAQLLGGDAAADRDSAPRDMDMDMEPADGTRHTD
ncbi:sigma-70 family RNA polymerase sigma factor [Luteimonas sp. BDR2-5]|uniref:RNA polymerase sigma factor n=1 Tax=Proluteimonas luteida TaxID=2878685 RepID=UPI001E64969B|nr:sigma-70 family RNA polymerase sigma factor [Luteimonas sp. BDR2-5]MCD9029123.1 sigma-70 family RNA polymerase sigma factor [Luteimonas sp. BDR2-5]